MSASKRNIVGLILLLFFFRVFHVGAQSTEVIVKGIRSSKGCLYINVYEDEESFKKDKPILRQKISKSTLKNGQIKVNFSLASGAYGMGLLDDENNDGEMNYNLIGMPKEGFGFSDYYHTTLTMPKFEDFVFQVPEKKQVEIKIRYM